MSTVHRHKNAASVTSLRSDDPERDVVRKRIAALRLHPEIGKVSRQMASSLVRRYEGNRIANRVLNDRARAIFAIMVLYLHTNPDASGTRLTAGRIIGLCQETGMCSRGRAKAMLLLMRWAGYIEPTPDLPSDADRRQRPLSPTQALLDDYTARWSDVFGSIALVDEIGVQALARIEEPEFRAGLSEALMRRFRAGWRVLDFTPPLELFAARDCGFVMLLALTLSAPEGSPFPPSGPLKIPVAALGRRFHVSRAHVLKMLRDAEAEGLLRRVSDGDGATVELQAPVRSALTDFFCAIFLLFGDAGREALARMTPKS